MADVREELMQWMEKRFERYTMPRFVRDVLAERQKMQQARTEGQPDDEVPLIKTD
ncbi:MAG: hypothetical protein GY821_05155 [Gammaproteobacteria bacterium]|nr:hypothetical protein [Gammaproteobacteria bacterium]